MQRLLSLASTHARLCLIAGLLGGLFLPGLAALMVPWLPLMVAGLLTVTALRIGHRAALGAVGDVTSGVVSTLVLQMVLPVALFGLLIAVGWHNTKAGLALVLTCAAPTITGSVNLALLMRLDAGRTMQLLVLGTAIFPLTILPVLFLLPQLGETATVIWAAIKLLIVILASATLGFGLRHWLFPNPSADQIKALDGLSTLAFAGIAIGLMAAITPALLRDPWAVAGWSLLAFGICFPLQLATLVTLRHRTPSPGPLALAAGNRNIAIFLVALPPEVMAPLMIFIGCWQLPMYLTPLLLPRLYTWALRDE